MSDIEFVSGLYFKEKHENAPDFIKGKLSIQREKLLEWLNGRQANEDGFINCDIKIAKSGKPYIAVDTWKPTQQQEQNNNHQYS